MVREDNAWVDKVLPTLPTEWQEYLFSDDLVDNAMEQFDALDADGNGTLTPDELVPVIVSMSESKPWDIDAAQCVKFVEIFDADANGTIERVEFFRLMQFIIVMSYLQQSDENGGGAAAAASAEEEMQEEAFRIDDVLAMVRDDAGWVDKVLPTLPQEWQDYLFSDELIDRAMGEFDALDADGSGNLSPDELAPVIVELSKAQPWSVSLEHCLKFAAVFDADGNGTIERDEFLKFVHFQIGRAHV